jgi:hypothetical protein
MFIVRFPPPGISLRPFRHPFAGQHPRGRPAGFQKNRRRKHLTSRTIDSPDPAFVVTFAFPYPTKVDLKTQKKYPRRRLNGIFSRPPDILEPCESYTHPEYFLVGIQDLVSNRHESVESDARLFHRRHDLGYVLLLSHHHVGYHFSRVLLHHIDFIKIIQKELLELGAGGRFDAGRDPVFAALAYSLQSSGQRIDWHWQVPRFSGEPLTGGFHTISSAAGNKN